MCIVLCCHASTDIQTSTSSVSPASPYVEARLHHRCYYSMLGQQFIFNAGMRGSRQLGSENIGCPANAAVLRRCSRWHLNVHPLYEITCVMAYCLRATVRRVNTRRSHMDVWFDSSYT